MTNNTIHKAITTAIALVSVGAFAAGCTSGSTSGPPPLDTLDDTSSLQLAEPSLSYPPSLGIDAQDQDNVAVGAVSTIYTWQFDTDEDQRDAARRAQPLMSATLADQLTRLPPQPFITYRLWDDWKSVGARTHVTATVAAEQHPDDTPSQWRRKIATTITVSDSTGKQLHRWSFAVLATVQKQAGQWLVAQFRPLAV